MKKYLLVLLLAVSLISSCSKEKDSNAGSNADCGTHNGKQLFRGPEGGCYYLSSGGNKEYVERSECQCKL